MRKIKQAAIKFIKRVNKTVSFETLEQYLSSLNCDVMFYNTKEGDELINKYGLSDYIQHVHAITVRVKGKLLIFIDNNLSSEDKLRSLLHEVGHIELRHLDENQYTANTRQQDMEAEAFAYHILSYDDHKSTLIVIATSILCMTIVILLFFTRHAELKTVTPHNSISVTTPCVDGSMNASAYFDDDIADTVFVTPSGTKFHREGCRYIKDKKCTTYTRNEVPAKYTPCSVCKP